MATNAEIIIAAEEVEAAERNLKIAQRALVKATQDAALAKDAITAATESVNSTTLTLKQKQAALLALCKPGA